MKDEDANFFVPSSLLSELRRLLVEKMGQGAASVDATKPKSTSSVVMDESTPVQAWQPEYKHFGYLYNIANEQAHDFYEEHGLKRIEPAFELKQKQPALIMQCRHCIRYSLGYCVKRGGQRPTWKEPLFLELGDGRRFRLEFACNECQMNVYSV